jgi:hypothetical protein
MLRSFLLLSAFLFLSVALSAQSCNKNPEIDRPDNFAAIIAFLSSDRMEGRETGSGGSILASDFIAVLMQTSGLEPFGDRRSWFQNFKMIRFNTGKSETGESEYVDGDYFLEGDTTVSVASVKIDTLSDRNVTGILYGKDTTKSIIIGAHYDHLGMRNGQTYNGADDNASGVTGMLALAKKWAASGEMPPCNIVFGAWAAEEKGQLGSHYFVRHTDAKPGKVLICFNMDMISRSAPEDSTGRQLSIGTLPTGENLRQIAKEINKGFKRPFEFDLWDVTGHTGSDYRFFSEAGIPVMTFFSGYNADYHTPDDTSDKIDLQKMDDILILVNECIRKVLINAYSN